MGLSLPWIIDMAQARPTTQEDLDAIGGGSVQATVEAPVSQGKVARPSSPEELAAAVPIQIAEEQGVTNWERLFYKVLNNNPEAAKTFFEQQGYDVIEYGREFAVRKSPDEPFKPIDPEGIEWQDALIDIAPELAVGAVTEFGRFIGGVLGAGVGAAGGPAGMFGGGLAGEMAGAGVTGAVEDLALQTLGIGVGINKEINPYQLGAVGAISAAMPLAGRMGGKALGKALRGSEVAGEGGRNILARFAGFADEFNLPAGESLVRTARRGKAPAPSLKDAVDITTRIIDGVKGKKFPEVVQIERMFVSGGPAAPRIDVTDEIDALVGLRPSEAVSDEAERLIKSTRRKILSLVNMDKSGKGIDLVTGAPNRVVVSPETALALKRLFGDISADAGLFKGTPVPKLKKGAEKRAMSAFATIREKLKQSLPENLRGDFDDLNKVSERKMKAIRGLERALGPASDAIQASIEQGQKVSPEVFFSSLFGKTSQTKLSAVREFDDVFQKDLMEIFESATRGTPAERMVREGLLEPRLEEVGREAVAGTPFGGGMPGIIPPLTAVGTARSTAAVESVARPFMAGALGGFFGGPFGAAAGFATASPRALSFLTREAISANVGTKKILEKLAHVGVLDKLPPAMRSQAFALFQQGVKRLIPEDRPVVREDKSAKRKELEGR